MLSRRYWSSAEVIVQMQRCRGVEVQVHDALAWRVLVLVLLRVQVQRRCRADAGQIQRCRSAEGVQRWFMFIGDVEVMQKWCRAGAEMQRCWVGAEVVQSRCRGGHRQR
jgi:hypothetical protein